MFIIMYMIEFICGLIMTSPYEPRVRILAIVEIVTTSVEWCDKKCHPRMDHQELWSPQGQLLFSGSQHVAEWSATYITYLLHLVANVDQHWITLKYFSGSPKITSTTRPWISLNDCHCPEIEDRLSNHCYASSSSTFYIARLCDISRNSEWRTSDVLCWMLYCSNVRSHKRPNRHCSKPPRLTTAGSMRSPLSKHWLHLKAKLQRNEDPWQLQFDQIWALNNVLWSLEKFNDEIW